MTRQYAENKIREALAQAQGNTTKARQLVGGWALEDARLMQELCRPHLTGIIAHAVGRVVHQQEVPPAPIPDMPEPLNMPAGAFGREILGALSGTGATFGDEIYSGQTGHFSSGGRKPASKSHIEAIRRLTQGK